MQTPLLARTLLDSVHDQMQHSTDAKPVAAAMRALVSGLRKLRDYLPAGDWREYVKATRRHPLIHLIHQDPFTCRCYYKPRGYAGDAKMIDYIYGFVDEDEHITSLGRSLMEYGINSQASQAVRRRRDLLAEYIADVRQDRQDARVLAVACGHLREAHLTIDKHPISDFVAIDQDSRSIATTHRLFGTRGVRALQWRVRDVIANRRRGELGSFDLIYAAGLYDYLSDDVARKLTRSMFDMLASGGTLLVANFVPSLEDVGYMEALMDWYLIYRTEEQLPECASAIELSAIASQRVFTDEHSAIAFLELVKS